MSSCGTRTPALTLFDSDEQALDRDRALTDESLRISILSVSPFQDDHAALEKSLRSLPWTVRKAFSLRSAQAMVRDSRIQLILCERDLHPGSWKELLTDSSSMPKPPFLIVTSRFADDHLWAEALNLGAYDVLAKPFDSSEVTRTLSLAGLRWRESPAHLNSASED